LAPYAAGFREDLARRGYSPWTATAHLQLMEHVSRWLVLERLGPGGLTTAAAQRFLLDRRASGQVRLLSVRGLAPLLGYLRGLGVVPDAAQVAADGPLERLLAAFADYLISERGLSESTVCYYRSVSRRFLSPWRRPDGVAFEDLTAAEVRGFVLDERRQRSVGSVKNSVTALRALLRFAYLRRYTDTPLDAAAPAAAWWRGGSMPQVLRAEHLVRLLGSCDRRTAVGCRDYAILVVLSRLGLRACEVVALTVDDVDWRAGEILVSGKGARRERLPLPVDVGEALADYCRRGRDRGGCRRLFLSVRAPYAGLSPSAANKVVARACEHAGLAPVGAHRLRHSAAAAMRRAGARWWRSARCYGTSTRRPQPATARSTPSSWRSSPDLGRGRRDE